jgi:hypothetical protein
MKEKKPTHGDIEVRDALRWVTDVLECSQIPFFVLGDLVLPMIEDKPAEVEKVEIGVLKNSWNDTTKSLLKTFFLRTPFEGIDLDTQILKLDFNGVPIEVKVIQRNYEFFKNLDTSYYWTDEYKIPNPWAKYLKSRYLIK